MPGNQVITAIFNNSVGKPNQKKRGIKTQNLPIIINSYLFLKIFQQIKQHQPNLCNYLCGFLTAKLFTELFHEGNYIK